MKMPVLAGNDLPEIPSAFLLKIFHPAEFFSVLGLAQAPI
jgi:hypothetical protein